MKLIRFQVNNANKGHYIGLYMYWNFYTENTTISVKPPLTFVTESNQLRIWKPILTRLGSEF